MGLDMYLHAELTISGGYDHVRNNFIHEQGQPVRLEPRSPKPLAARQFDAILRTLRLGKFEDFHERYPEGNSIEVKIQVGYWRKANAVHQWFVTNAQNGVDECQLSYVTRDQLTTLRDTCQIILNTVSLGEPVIEKDFFGQEYTDYPDATLDVEVAKAELGTQAGFFFGDTSYGYGYIYDLQDTVKQLTAVLDDSRFEAADFYYRSSW